MTGVTTTILLRNDYSCYVMNQAIQSVPVFIARPHNEKKISLADCIFFLSLLIRCLLFSKMAVM